MTLAFIDGAPLNVAPENAAAFFNFVPLVLGLAFYVFIFALVIIVLIRLARFLGKANREQQLTRIELGKVADEVQKMRHEIEDISVKLPSSKKE